MVEIAISIAIVAFALVAIIGVLPTGFDVQRQNRENTIINQEGNLWLEALRGGAWGMDYLTNHVDQINMWLNQVKVVEITNTLGSSSRIIGLMTQPSETIGVGVSRWEVEAYVRAITGSAAEQTTVRSPAFTYRLTVELRRFSFQPEAHTNLSVSGLSPFEYAARSNLWRKAQAMAATTYDLRLALDWPVYQVNGTNRVGNNRKLFRTLINGGLLSDMQSGLPVGLHWLRPLGSSPNQL